MAIVKVLESATGCVFRIWELRGVGGAQSFASRQGSGNCESTGKCNRLRFPDLGSLPNLFVVLELWWVIGLIVSVVWQC